MASLRTHKFRDRKLHRRLGKHARDFLTTKQLSIAKLAGAGLPAGGDQPKKRMQLLIDRDSEPALQAYASARF